MQQLKDQLKSYLKDSIQSSASAYAILPMGINTDNPNNNDWINVLETAKWKCTNMDGKSHSLEIKKKRFLRNIGLFAVNVSIQMIKKPLMAVYAQVTCDRDKEFEETIEGCKYENMQKRKEDFPYNVDRTWLKKNLGSLSLYNLENGKPIIYSVSTIAGEDIPACKHCHGLGKIACEDCNGTGWIICEVCQGTGEMQYEAGNYANGEMRIKSKTCSHCNGEGKIPCLSCNGQGEKTCSVCHGSGKMSNENCVQKVKSFKNSFSLEGSLDILVSQKKEKGKWDEEEDSDTIVDNIYPYNLDANEVVDYISSLQISKLYSSPHQLVEDNSATIKQDVLANGGELAELFYNYVQDRTIDEEHTVCVVENYYSFPPVTAITIRYSIGEYESDFSIYVWDGLAWSDNLYAEVSLWQLIVKLLKRKNR